MRQLLLNSDLIDSRILSSVYGTLELFMTGPLILKEDSPPLIFLNPGGSNRTVNLPILERGMSYRISHVGLANTISIRDSNSVAIVSLAFNEVVDLTASAVGWTFIAGSNETGTGGGGGLANAYVALTDGTNSAVAVGGDTIKFRTGSLLTGVITNDDVTHGDNLLISHGTYPARSVLANATSGAALPSALTSSTDGDVLWRSSGALVFAPLNLATVGLTGVLPIANGGTAGSTTQSAINNIGQLTTIGDILYHNGTNHQRFPRGSDGQVLTAQTATGLAWANANAHSHTHSDISDWDEATQDTIGTSLLSSTSITLSYNDAAGQITAQRAALTGDTTAALNGNATTTVSASTSFAFSGIISDLGLAVSQNNYNPAGLANATTIRISSTGVIDITGIVGGAAGRLLVLQNVGSNAITLKNENASSTATNRFALNNDIPLSTNQTVALLYDATTTRWRATGAPSPAGSLTDGDKGDITVSGSGAIFTIDADAVTFAKIQNIATDSLIGRDTAGSGDPENILLNATLSMDGAGNLQRAALTGDVSANAGSNTTVINNSVVTYAKIQNVSNTDRLLGRDTAGAGVIEELSVDATLVFTGAPGLGRAPLTGDVTAPAASNATTIANDAVTYAKMQNVTTNQRVIGRDTGAPADPQELAISTVLDWIGATQGSVLYRGVSAWSALTPGTSGQVLTTNGASANPSWTTVSGGGGLTDGDKGDITVSGSGTVWTIDANAVTYNKMQDFSVTQRVNGRNTAGSGDPEEVTAAQILDWLGNTRGSVLYRGLSAWTILTPGTFGFALTSQGPGADPIWSASSAVVGDGDKGDVLISSGVWTVESIGGVPVATINPIGRQTIWVPAGSMTSRATAGSENTTRTVNGITMPVQKFDQTTQEGVNFDVAFPKSWNNGTVFFQPYWTAASGAGTAIFQLRGGCFADNVSINTTGFGTAVSSTDTFQNADRVHVSPESAAVTLSNAAVDRLAFFELVRDVATDTLTADAELIGIKLIYLTAAGSDT